MSGFFFSCLCDVFRKFMVLVLYFETIGEGLPDVSFGVLFKSSKSYHSSALTKSSISFKKNRLNIVFIFTPNLTLAGKR